MSCQQLAVVLLSSCYAAGLANAQPAESESPDSTETLHQWEYQITFAYPLSERTEIAVAQDFCQLERSSLSWSCIHLMLSHQLTNGTVAGLSPSLSFDFEHAVDHTAGNVLVSQIALDHQRGNFSFTVAPFHEHGWAPGSLSSHSAGVDCFAFHAFTDRLSAGIESHWKVDLNHNDPTVDDLYIVPAASLTSGSLSYSLGLAIGLNEGSGEPLVRFALGMSL